MTSCIAAVCQCILSHALPTHYVLIWITAQDRYVEWVLLAHTFTYTVVLNFIQTVHLTRVTVMAATSNNS